MRIAIIGVGHQGRYHAKSLKHVEGVSSVLLIDREIGKAKTVAEEYQMNYAGSHKGRLSDFDAAIIAVPTTDHASIARELIEAGKHVLIEKPVTSTVEDAISLDDLTRKKGVVGQVGFPERFNPAVEKARDVITRPLFVETHRLGVFSPRSLDVDVVLDLMIHDLDLLYLFLGEEPSELEAVGIPILSKNIDIANARLKFPKGCVVNVTASRVSAKKMRKMRLFQPYSYLSIDFADQSVSSFSLQPNLCNAGFPEINRLEFRAEPPQHSLQRELGAFFGAIQGKQGGGVTIGEAIPSLKMALAVKAKFNIPEFLAPKP
ncbi:MAG TPA: Gfo/Idh/MocA family oxidoreductase [Acidobacteriota bacterium]|nr:Gfo/Idh/MocA family oxidoreductase [Acidobacteriota bacterium]